jgi:hypothetical protein
MTDDQAERIASALERIADRLELLTAEPSVEPPPTSEEMPCLHPEDQRLALGATNGWVCTACQYRESPS